ncbi:MAG TPA: PqiC family protein [Casimicrobiaceae bacterium]|nr:PqiC family protein [Casimicrobiaceae bacterium]
MSRYSLRFALVWLASAVGCTSVPVRYYTLTPPPDQASPASQTSLAIDVRVVHTPPQLNRPELMLRTGPTEVTLLDNERWASPVKDELKDAVRLELQRRFSRMTGLRPELTKLTLDIDVRHLEAELGRYALLDVSWSATLTATDQRSNGAQAATCTFRADEKIHAGYAGIVEGYQREVAALADAIVAVVTNPAGAIDAACEKSIEDH